MLNSKKNIRFWSGISPWLLVAALAVLVPIIAFMTIDTINGQKENTRRLLIEKGAALIRSFEAGTRTGMMGDSWGNRQLQRLIIETAQQPDIAYILVADKDGGIVAHSNPDIIGQHHPISQELLQSMDIKSSLDPQPYCIDSGKREDLFWRLVSDPTDKNIFEVFRQFSPSGHKGGISRRIGWKMRHGRWKNKERRHGMMPGSSLNFGKDTQGRQPDSPQAIFVGMDMKTLEDARQASSRQSIIMGVILILVGFSLITIFFIANNYRATRISLSQIKAFSDNLVASIPIGLTALDKDKRVASLNNAAEQILGVSEEESIGKRATDLLPKELVDQLGNLDQNAQTIEKELECELPGVGLVPLEISGSRLYDASGNFFGYALLFKDLTEIRTLRQEIVRSQRLASIGSLAAGVAHEIRNPLSSIKGFATYFRDRYADIEKDKQTATIMIQEVDRLNRAVTQLLELSKPVNFSSAPIEISGLINDSLELIGQKALENQIEVKTEFAAETIAAIVDADRMRQVFLNLFLNAIESMKDGGTLSVEVSKDDAAGLIQISIADTGLGIEPDVLLNIFDPYFTTRPTGTGLGLAIVHSTIEAHRGSITVEDTSKNGTTFIITLPFGT